MTDDTWSNEELEAAVEAYLQMLWLEAKGQAYNKTAISRALIAGPLKGRTSTDRRMQNISAVLQEMGRNWIPGFKPLANIGTATRKAIKQIVDRLESLNYPPIALLPPVESKNSRGLPPTGYWMFICNRHKWDGETFLRSGQEELFYKVSEHNRYEVQVGDLGVLRLNKKAGTKKRPTQPAGIYALVEVVAAPDFKPDPDNLWNDEANGEREAWRARIRILVNLVDMPFDVELLPEEEDYKFIKLPVPTSTIPISRRAFMEIVARSKLDGMTLSLARYAGTIEGVRRLEAVTRNLDPQRKERVSKYIERGPIGAQVKEARAYSCQICEALGQASVAFLKADGAKYAEAHHVEPVSLLKSGSLSEQNIMVLCPNHHRQAHYGHFAILEENENTWRISLDGRQFMLARTKLD
jgi:hypothetical protein